MQTKKVLLVRNASASDFGGGENYSISLAKELIKHGFVVIIGSAHKQIRKRSKLAELRTITVPRFKLQNLSGVKILLFPIYLLWLTLLTISYLYICIAKRIDVLHLQSRDDFIAGSIAGRLLGRRVLWTDHADLKYIFANINKPFKNPIGKMVYQCTKISHKIIVVSDNEMLLIKKVLGRRKANNFTRIYNGVTDQIIQPKRLPGEKGIIFSLTSRLVSTKGIVEVIEASKELERKKVRHTVLLIGEGPEESKFRTLAGESIRFLGYPTDALSIVAGSDVFIHPTYNEAFSISLVEAAMLGKPVITTDVGGNPEIIKNNLTGRLIEPGDADQLCWAMLEFSKNPQLSKKYGTALRQKYLECFQWDKIVFDQIVPLYIS